MRRFSQGNRKGNASRKTWERNTLFPKTISDNHNTENVPENISLDNSEATLFDNDNEVVTTTGEETFENIPDQFKTENVSVILELIQSFFFSVFMEDLTLVEKVEKEKKMW